jgi:opacity protein-like surface antigen
MVAETRIGETFSIQAEPCLVQKGSEINFAPSYTRLRLYYVQVPFTIKARLVHGLVIPYVFIGPNVGLLLTAKAETNVYGGSQEFDVKQNYSKSDVALDLGAGFEYEISTSAVLTLDIRYSLGLSNIDRTNTESVRTRSIQLLVGTVFRI